MRKIFYAATLILVIGALEVVPIQRWYILRATPATPVPSILDVDGALDEVSGELMLTTVRTEGVSVLEYIEARIEDTPILVLPAERTNAEFYRQQEQVFADSTQIAAVVGLGLAGHDAGIVGDGVFINSVAEGSPADGELRPGDVIVAIDGEPLGLASELIEHLAGRAAGDEVELTVERDDQELTVSIVLEELERLGRPGIGVEIGDLNARATYPPGIDVRETTRIGGPSAGLMIALTIYDLFEPSDLTRGRVVAGTGEIDLDGNVGNIGGIEIKVRGAHSSGATIFLAPAEQADDARAAAPEGIEVIAVATIEEAIAALSAG